ncbi:MAG: hypothetical protein A2V66_06160 [Ignavibacteria bacterium RBG_13_36_8]|nr:MAG: hypothetical protein A2V66_06160 [Ignavibacteria bacterium RBG_13_36_8]
MKITRSYGNLPDYVLKYLKKFGQDKWTLELNEEKKFDIAIVIPAVMEYDNIRKLLVSLVENDKTYFHKCVIIFVINQIRNSIAEIKEDNDRSLKLLRSIVGREKGNKDALVKKVVESGLNIGLVDAASEGLQFNHKDGGVGLARKIGMDLALTVQDYNHLSTKRILVCLDADCRVDRNYIIEVYNSFQRSNISGAYIKFRHEIEGDETVHRAMICYEIFLRYYVLGLKIAGSPFAFHTVGSTLACDADSYVKIGGMNRKKAGEDFYFMEKLAKIGEIYHIDKTTVYPAGRDSWRVPFGTGPRVKRFKQKTHDEYQLYSFKSFLLLKAWLNIFYEVEVFSSDQYLKAVKDLNEVLYNFLFINSFKDEWNKILENSKTTAQIHKQKLLWFDGFRTLKFIHYLRDNAFPDENMFDVLEEVFAYLSMDIDFGREKGAVPDVQLQVKYLDKLRELT